MLFYFILLEVESVSSISNESYEDSSSTLSSEEDIEASQTESNDPSDEEHNDPPLPNLEIDPAWSIPLYPGSHFSVLLAVIVISSFATAAALTNDGLQNLLDLICLLLPGDCCNLPKTTYLFNKIIPPYKPLQFFLSKLFSALN